MGEEEDKGKMNPRQQGVGLIYLPGLKLLTRMDFEMVFYFTKILKQRSTLSLRKSDVGWV